MFRGIFNIALRSVVYHRQKVIQQAGVVALLAAIITGSLLTGFSVRETLRRSTAEKLGRTKFLISSGLRYFNRDLPDRLNEKGGIKCTSLLETEGFVEVFGGGNKTLKTKVYGIGKGFFSFQGAGQVSLKEGEAAVNPNLAAKLNIKTGDQIIVTLEAPSDVPASSPFAVPPASGNSGVFTVISIPGSENGGNFSLSISQAQPDNIFLGLDEELFRHKINRILVSPGKSTSERDLMKDLESSLAPSDFGLSVRKVKATGEVELISSRIFIDQPLLDAVRQIIPEAKPVISYLVNSISCRGASAPYSFAAGVDLAGQPGDGLIEINDWLAGDITAHPGDTVRMTWFSPSNTGSLAEISGSFIIGSVVHIKGAEADSMLMPEFPGIAGKASCSRWSAGVDIRTDLIRKKDEEYWNRYRGTPKILMTYEKARELWGSNFGPASAIRIPSTYTTDEVQKALTGNISPSSAGFSVSNIQNEMNEAAEKSVDFGTLFLGLGFFIIVSCLVILVLAASSYFETRRKELSVYRTLGFTERWIQKFLGIESVLVSFTGSFAGAMAGIFINFVLIKALNGVWTGAVQTESLKAYTGSFALFTGCIVTFVLSSLFLRINVTRFLKRKIREDSDPSPFYSFFTGKIPFLIILPCTTLLLVINFTSVSKPAGLALASGISLFIALLVCWTYYSARRIIPEGTRSLTQAKLSARYYEHHPSAGIMPALLIAAGLFAVVITGVSRLKISNQSLSASGGTGGVRYWVEFSVPVREDLNTLSGKRKHGLESLPGEAASFIQCKKAPGNDASCLNLNFVAAPAILGLDPADFIKNRAFSFSSLAKGTDAKNPWGMLLKVPDRKTIYGFADQTVLEWGLKKRTGDTIRLRSETGDVLNVVIAGGLKSSIFQGYLIIGMDNFNRFYPSVPGYSVMMVRDASDAPDSIPGLLSRRMENYGITVQSSSDRLASFFTVTNTYLSVFTMLGFLGMILGVTGLGLVLKRTYDSRKREFALMISAGFRLSALKRMIFLEQVRILLAGILTGVLPGLVSSSSSFSSFGDIPWLSILLIAAAIAAAGVLSLVVSLRGIRQQNLVAELRKE